MACPQYLFRAYSDESGGTNTPTLFEPYIYASGSASRIEDVARSTVKLADCLRNALLWRDGNIDNPFINWTDSFLLAIVFALYKAHPKPGNPRRSTEHNIHIICMLTATATDDSGNKAVFTKSSELMRRYGIDLRQPYDNEFASVGRVRVGIGSFVLSLDKAISEGLYKLHPALLMAFNRPDPHWRLTTIDVRNFWHSSEAPLTIGHIELAARLAGTAIQVHQSKAYPLPLLAAFLAMQRRSDSDNSLRSWLSKYGDVELVEVQHRRHCIKPTAADVDTVQFYRLLDILNTKNIIWEPRLPCLDGRQLGTEHEVTEWTAFQHSRKAKRREEIMSEPDYDPSRRQTRAIRMKYGRERRDRRAEIGRRRQRRYA